jgi:hypothetical protein
VLQLRALLRRIDPDLQALVAVPDYPLILADGHADSFAAIPRTPPLNTADASQELLGIGLGSGAEIEADSLVLATDPATFAPIDS